MIKGQNNKVFFPLHNIVFYLFSFQKTWAPLNLDRLQHWIDNERIDPSQPITMKHLLDTRCVRGVKDGVKLLADVST